MGQTLEFGFSDLPQKRQGFHLEVPEEIMERVAASEFADFLAEANRSPVSRTVNFEQTDQGTRLIVDGVKLGQATDYERRLQLRTIFGLINGVQAVASVTEYDPAMVVMPGIGREGHFFPMRARVAWGSGRAQAERAQIFERLLRTAVDLKLAAGQCLTQSINLMILRRDGVRFNLGLGGGGIGTNGSYQPMRPTFELTGKARTYEEQFVLLVGTTAIAVQNSLSPEV